MTPKERVRQLYTSECTCPLPPGLPADLLRPLMVNCEKCLTDMVRLDRQESIKAENEACAVAAWVKARTIGIITLFHEGQADAAGKQIAAAIRGRGE